MPGTLVRDALAVDLLADVALDDEGAAQNGTAWDAQWPGDVQFNLDITSVTGTTPTLDITVEGSEVSDFASGVVEYGHINAGDEADGAQLGFTTYINSRYVRAVADVGGTSVVYTAALEAILPHDRRVRGVSPNLT